jgi:hypothetical protein
MGYCVSELLVVQNVARGARKHRGQLRPRAD